MPYGHARKLHDGDETIRTGDGRPPYVVTAVDDKSARSVVLACGDGRAYRRTEAR